MIQKQKISKWYEEGWLTHAFQRSLGTQVGGVWTVFFEDFWIPVRKATNASGPPDNPTGVNFGLNAEQIAAAYWSYFGGNYFLERFDRQIDFDNAAASGESRVINKIKAVFEMYKSKYTKLIELAGYYYNPLFNVDGVEMFSTADAHGSETETSDFETTNTHKISTYETDAKEEYEDKTKSKTGGNTLTRSHESTGINVSGGDDAFSSGITGADMYHIEKRIRQGNIGVTKSQELVEAERASLRFNVLNEFFTDINKVVLIGLY